MKAVQISEYGARPSLVDVDSPRPRPDEVVVKVAGAALNPLDLKMAAGYMHDFFPVDFPTPSATTSPALLRRQVARSSVGRSESSS